jgi:hypothetical protein
MQFEAFRPQGEASRQCNIIYIVSLHPAYRQAGEAGLSGHIPVRFQILDFRCFNLQFIGFKNGYV